jgi:hypothetical protein
MLTRLLSALFLCVIATGASAEIFDPFAVPFKQTDLQYPNSAQPYGKEHADMLFKPDGAGPFPGLVLVPVCGGETYSHALHDWAKRAIDRGYAVMVADPLWQRKVEDNCDDPIPVPMSRMLKDAFDAPRRFESSLSSIRGASELSGSHRMRIPCSPYRACLIRAISEPLHSPPLFPSIQAARYAASRLANAPIRLTCGS